MATHSAFGKNNNSIMQHDYMQDVLYMLHHILGTQAQTHRPRETHCRQCISGSTTTTILLTLLLKVLQYTFLWNVLTLRLLSHHITFHRNTKYYYRKQAWLQQGLIVPNWPSSSSSSRTLWRVLVRFFWWFGLATAWHFYKCGGQSHNCTHNNRISLDVHMQAWPRWGQCPS